MPVFNIKNKDNNARVGVLNLAHAKVKTPFFMPVATKGALKNIKHSEVKNLGIECIISNAFINYLKPGLSLIKEAKGLHNFMSWEKGLFTDSGGFQLILDDFVDKITDKGVYFRNPFDKSIELITPKKAIEIQNILGSDVAMCLDHQPKFGQERSDYLDSCIRTIEWAKECKSAHINNKNKTTKNQLIFGITQGGIHTDLRVKTALALEQIGFDGIALGGFGIGEAQVQMKKVLKETKKVLPENRPIYVMGIGSPLEILAAIKEGADMFDSVYPMRMARHGLLLTRKGKLKIERGKYKNDFSKVDEKCSCELCKNHSKAFLHHLFKTHEQNAHVLASLHNLTFINDLIKDSRIAIEKKEFKKFKRNFEKNYKN
jgi:queuine tRNA-ribosyltransferase